MDKQEPKIIIEAKLNTYKEVRNYIENHLGLNKEEIINMFDKKIEKKLNEEIIVKVVEKQVEKIVLASLNRQYKGDWLILNNFIDNYVNKVVTDKVKEIINEKIKDLKI